MKKKLNKKLVSAIVAAVLAAIVAVLGSMGTKVNPMVVDALGQQITAAVSEIEIEECDTEEPASTGAFIIEGAGNVPAVR